MAYMQAMARRKRLLHTYRQIKDAKAHYTGSGVWYDNERGFYYRYTASNTPGYAKSLRKISNKKIRRTTNVGNHGKYRRSFDYKWTLF